MRLQGLAARIEEANDTHEISISAALRTELHCTHTHPHHIRDHLLPVPCCDRAARWLLAARHLQHHARQPAAAMAALTEDQAAVYDRQLRVWGVEVQKRRVPACRAAFWPRPIGAPR